MGELYLVGAYHIGIGSLRHTAMVFSEERSDTLKSQSRQEEKSVIVQPPVDWKVDLSLLGENRVGWIGAHGLPVSFEYGITAQEFYITAAELGFKLYLSREFLDSFQGSSTPPAKTQEPVKYQELQWKPTPPKYGCARIYEQAGYRRRHGQYWSQDEEDNLEEMYLSGKYTLKEIAEYHQRSEGAVEGRLGQLNLVTREPLNDVELAKAAHIIDTGGDLESFAREVGRGPSYCKHLVVNHRAEDWGV